MDPKLLVTNLHPSFFEFPLPTPPIELRTRDSIEAERRVPTDLFRNRPAYNNYQEVTSAKNYVTGKTNVLGNIQGKNGINEAFFSRKNIIKLQKLIRYQVWEASGRRHVIGDQSETELLVIMRSIYFQYSRNPIASGCKKACAIIQNEVDRLNLFVLRDTIPTILTDVEQHIAYLRDAGRQPVPPDRPLGLSNRGTRELRSVTDVLVGDEFSNSTVQF